jgi:hypothetical protein
MNYLTYDALRRILEKFPVLTGKARAGMVTMWNDGVYYTMQFHFGDAILTFDEDTYGPAGITPFAIADGVLHYTGSIGFLADLSPFTTHRPVRLS